MRKPTTKKKKKLEMPLRYMVQARGPRWRFHRPHALGVVMPAIPVYRGAQDDSHPTQCCAVQIALLGHVQRLMICTLFEKMKMYSGVWVSQPAACAFVIWLTRVRTVSRTQENQRPRQTSGGVVTRVVGTFPCKYNTYVVSRKPTAVRGQSAVVVCTYPYYIPTYLHRDNEHRIFVCIQKVSIFQANDTIPRF